MARVLKESFGVTALALHDRPPEHFQPLSQAQRCEVLQRIAETAPQASKLQSGATKLIISSTSWTPDEDFSLLLDALVTYSSQAQADTSLPHILAIITGKGPQKEHYLTKIKQLKTSQKLFKVDIETAWLSMEDYASLLGAADVGISLHTSSSGVDLPMKVVDMFGTGLPVFGWCEFEAWPELVTEDVNGKGFGSAAQLDELLVEYLPHTEKLSQLRQGAMKETERRWDEEWDAVAAKVLKIGHRE
jgi:beta-1,4-mannosyltransferase